MKSALACLVLLLSLSCAAARFHRSGVKDDFSSGYDLRNDQKHTYYVLIKQDERRSLESAELLGGEFSKRLGEDSNVHFVPASKVRISNSFEVSCLIDRLL
jgi:hypothetical protein